MVFPKQPESRRSARRNISPLLSNIILNELDKELEMRGLHFTRYADDVLIVVKSEAEREKSHELDNLMDRKKTRVESKYDETKISKPSGVKISRNELLQRKKKSAMETDSTQRICQGIE